jgi:hypothetical protein
MYPELKPTEDSQQDANQGLPPQVLAHAQHLQGTSATHQQHIEAYNEARQEGHPLTATKLAFQRGVDHLKEGHEKRELDREVGEATGVDQPGRVHHALHKLTGTHHELDPEEREKLKAGGDELVNQGIKPQIAFHGMHDYKPVEASEAAQEYEKIQEHSQRGSGSDSDSEGEPKGNVGKAEKGGLEAASAVLQTGQGLGKGFSDTMAKTVAPLNVAADVVNLGGAIKERVDASRAEPKDAAEEEMVRQQKDTADKEVVKNTASLGADVGDTVAAAANLPVISNFTGPLGAVVGAADTYDAGKKTVQYSKQAHELGAIKREEEGSPSQHIVANLQRQAKGNAVGSGLDTVTSALDTGGSVVSVIPPYGPLVKAGTSAAKATNDVGQAIVGEVEAHKIQRDRKLVEDDDPRKVGAEERLMKRDPEVAVQGLEMMASEGHPQAENIMNAYGLSPEQQEDPHSASLLAAQRGGLDLKQETVTQKLHDVKEKVASKLGHSPDKDGGKNPEGEGESS